MIPLLLGCLGEKHPTFTQTSAGDFIKAIITISANASQNEQSCIGPNSLTRQLVSETCIEQLIKDMLRGGNALTVGVGIIIEVIRKNNSDYDPDISNAQDQPPSSGDPIYLGTLLRLFAMHVPNFTDLILSPNHTVSDGETTKTVARQRLDVAFGGSIEPLGFDRFKTCELMAELLHCSNMGLLNEKGSEAHVRQRDAEREKLRAEGVLTKQREPRSAITEFSEDSNGFHPEDSGVVAEVGSPEALRRLEVTNNAEDDGFEEVGTSTDLLDEVKDDFDEKGPKDESRASKIRAPLQPSKPRLSLDDEFFDEPLTSPRLGPVQPEAEVVELHDVPDVRPPLPLSPATQLSTEVNELQLGRNSEATKSGTNDGVDTGGSESSQKASSSAVTPPLPRDESLVAEVSASPTSLFPQNGDTPAPLFSPTVNG